MENYTKEKFEAKYDMGHLGQNSQWSVSKFKQQLLLKNMLIFNFNFSQGKHRDVGSSLFNLLLSFYVKIHKEH